MAPLEIWKSLKDIVDCGDNYSVSNLGRIRNDLTMKIRKPKPSHGYLRMTLSLNGNKQTYQVHRLVLMAFSPIKNSEEMQVNHKDENPSNNELSNLEWCTCHYNQNYGTRNKKVSEGKLGDKNPMKRKDVVAKKYKKVVAYKNGEFIGIFESQLHCSEITGVSKNRISQICARGGSTYDGYTFHLYSEVSKFAANMENQLISS